MPDAVITPLPIQSPVQTGIPVAVPTPTPATDVMQASAVNSLPAVMPAGVPNPINLDLTSTTRSLQPPAMLQNTPVNIQVGSAVVPVTPQSVLTPAERLAVYQVVSTGQQSITLGQDGSAVGGTFTMGARFSQFVSNVVVPQGVTVLRDFATAGALNLTGTLTNSGTFYAASSNPGVTTASISAANIINQQGALLTSVLPAGGLPGISNAIGNLNLTLTAVQNILNAGTISSAGTLNLNAGGSITNALPAGVTGPPPVMQALNNMNIFAGSGIITNAGLIAASTGNINIAANLANNIAINNLNGTIQALAGAINVRDSSFAGQANLSIRGGDLLAKELNLNSGCGAVDVMAGKLEGTVNMNAGQTWVSAATKNLVLGKIQLSGDPAFYNTADDGDVIIAGTLQYSGTDLAIVASRDVLTAAGAGIIDTSTTSGPGRGGNVMIIAGANISTAPANPGQVQPNTPDPNDANITLVIQGASSSGGKIDLATGTPITQFSTGSANANGGNVALIAFNGANPTSTDPGTVKLPSALTITTGGVNTTSNRNGDVSVIAGGTTAQPVSLGGINTTGATGGGGGIFIYYGQPVVSTPTNPTITGGTLTAGSFSGGTSSASTVSIGDLSFFSSSGITIASPSSLQVGNMTTNGSNLAILSGGDITGAITGSSLNSTSSTGHGGHLVLLAGANITPNVAQPLSPSGVRTSLTAASHSLSGGKIDFVTGTTLSEISSSSTALGFNAGSITMLAYAGLSATSGTVQIPSTVTIQADSTGGGNGPTGGVWISAGSTTVTRSIDIGPVSITATGPNATDSTRNRIAVVAGVQSPSFSIVNGYLPTGSIAPSGTLGGAGSSLLVTGSLNASGFVQITAGTDVDIDGVTAGNALSINAGSTVATDALTAGANIQVVGPTNVFINGDINQHSPFISVPTLTITTESIDEFQIGTGAVTAGINGVVSTDALPASNRAAGFITVTNNGVGGIRVLSTDSISMVSDGNGNGPRFNLRANSGPLTLPSGVINASAAGVGTGLGGTIELRGATINWPDTGHLTLSVNSGSFENCVGCIVRGEISITDLNGATDLNIGTGSGKVEIQAFGTSKNISITGVRDLNIDPAGLLLTNGAFQHLIQFNPTGKLEIADSINLIAETIDLSGAPIIWPSTGHVGLSLGNVGSFGAILVKDLAGTADMSIGTGAGKVDIQAAGNQHVVKIEGVRNLNIDPVGLSFTNGETQRQIVLSAVGDLSFSDSISLNAIDVTLIGAPISWPSSAHVTVFADSAFQLGGANVQSLGSTADLDIGAGPGKMDIQTAGAFSFVTVAAGRNLNIDGSFLSFDDNARVSISADGKLVLTNSLGSPATMNNAWIDISAGEIDYTAGDIYAQQLMIKPPNSGAFFGPATLVSLGGTSTGPGFALTQDELVNRTHVHSLFVGRPDRLLDNFFDKLDIVLTEDLDLSSAEAKEIYLYTLATYTGTGHTLTLGSNQFLDIGAIAGLHSGTITAGASDLIVRTSIRPGPAGTNLVIDGPVSVTGAGTILIRANNDGSNIILGADVGGGATTLVETGSFSTVTRTAGTISGQDVSLSGFGEFGTITQSLNTSATNTLTVVTTGNAYINSLTPVSTSGFSVLGSLKLTSDHTITVPDEFIVGNVTLETNRGSNADIVLNAGIQSVDIFGPGISLIIHGTSQIVQNAGVLQSTSMYLQSDGVSIGTPSNPLQTVTSNLTALTCCGASVSVSNSGALALTDTSVGASLQVTNDDSIFVQNARTDNGSIDLTTIGGFIEVLPDSIITANNGDVTLQTTDLSFGAIYIDARARIGAFSPSTSLGNVFVLVGSNTQSNPTGSGPGFDVFDTNGGQVFLGSNGISLSGGGNRAFVDGRNVTFNSDISASSIVLGGDTTISAGPVSNIVSSLDLTNADVVNAILYLQSQGIITGDLQSTPSGVTGGFTLLPANVDFQLSAVNILAGVTVILQDFQAVNAVKVLLSNASTASNVVIAGTQTFTSSSSTLPVGVISIVDLNSSGTVQVSPSGILSSTGDLSLSSNITIANNGQVSAENNLVVQTVAGSLASIGGSGMYSANFLNQMGVFGIGQLNPTGALSGQSVELSNAGGDIGSVDNPVLIASQNLSLNLTAANGNAFVASTGALALGFTYVSGSIAVAANGGLGMYFVEAGGAILASALGEVVLENVFSGANFVLSTPAPISVLGSVTGNVISLTTTGIGQNDITLAGDLTALGAGSTIELRAGGTGSILAPNNDRIPVPGDTGGGGGGGGGGGVLFFSLFSFTGGGGPSSLLAESLHLETASGDIGEADHVINLLGETITLIAGGSGNVYASNSGLTGTLNASSAGGSFNFANFGDTTIGSITAGNGGISIFTQTGNMTILPGSIISATNGAVEILDQAFTDVFNQNRFLVGQGVTISSNSTDPALRKVSLLFGVTPTNDPGFDPGNLNSQFSNGGSASFGTYGITSLPPLNTLIADAGTIVTDVGSAGIASQLVLDGGVLITAGDVPATGGSGGTGGTGGSSGGASSGSFLKFGSVAESELLAFSKSGASIADLSAFFESRSSLSQASFVNGIGGSRVGTDTTPPPFADMFDNGGSFGDGDFEGSQYDAPMFTDNSSDELLANNGAGGLHLPPGAPGGSGGGGGGGGSPGGGGGGGGGGSPGGGGGGGGGGSPGGGGGGPGGSGGGSPGSGGGSPGASGGPGSGGGSPGGPGGGPGGSGATPSGSAGAPGGSPAPGGSAGSPGSSPGGAFDPGAANIANIAFVFGYDCTGAATQRMVDLIADLVNHLLQSGSGGGGGGNGGPKIASAAPPGNSSPFGSSPFGPTASDGGGGSSGGGERGGSGGSSAPGGTKGGGSAGSGGSGSGSGGGSPASGGAGGGGGSASSGGSGGSGGAGGSGGSGGGLGGSGSSGGSGGSGGAGGGFGGGGGGGGPDQGDPRYKPLIPITDDSPPTNDPSWISPQNNGGGNSLGPAPDGPLTGYVDTNDFQPVDPNQVSFDTDWSDPFFTPGNSTLTPLFGPSINQVPSNNENYSAAYAEGPDVTGWVPPDSSPGGPVAYIPAGAGGNTTVVDSESRSTGAKGALVPGIYVDSPPGSVAMDGPDRVKVTLVQGQAPVSLKISSIMNGSYDKAANAKDFAVAQQYAKEALGIGSTPTTATQPEQPKTNTATNNTPPSVGGGGNTSGTGGTTTTGGGGTGSTTTTSSSGPGLLKGLVNDRGDIVTLTGGVPGKAFVVTGGARSYDYKAVAQPGSALTPGSNDNLDIRGWTQPQLTIPGELLEGLQPGEHRVINSPTQLSGSGNITSATYVGTVTRTSTGLNFEGHFVYEMGGSRQATLEFNAQVGSNGSIQAQEGASLVRTR
jgi:hypothetical protein